MDYKIHWTRESIRNLEQILDYLINKWTQREVDNFKQKLSEQLDLIADNPYMFPISRYNGRLRKAVLSKQTTVYYEVKENTIYIAYQFVNRQDSNKLRE